MATLCLLIYLSFPLFLSSELYNFYYTNSVKILLSAYILNISYMPMGSPGRSDGKAPVCDAGDRVRSLGREDPLEKEMATHSSTLAWKISWTEEPGRLQSMGSQRVGHD